jgi:hypothetical protein
MREIDKLIGELQRAYDYLKYEGERLQSQVTRYAHLSRTTLASVKERGLDCSANDHRIPELFQPWKGTKWHELSS